LATMLADPDSRRRVEEARAIYADRRAKLVAALAERGVETSGSDGLNLWVRVPDEQATLVTLASHGIAVAPGRPFQLRPSFEGHVRVTTGSTSLDLGHVAELLTS
ncbi:MAG: aminotransferase class I/II-fold pyridoxal phosphate-dependent enzyme, partial [Acidimicrobiia bacterium]